MKRSIRFLLGSIYLSLGLVQPAPAADYAYVVSYIEATPAEKNKAADLFRRLSMLSRKDPGAASASKCCSVSGNRTNSRFWRCGRT